MRGFKPRKIDIHAQVVVGFYFDLGVTKHRFRCFRALNPPQEPAAYVQVRCGFLFWVIACTLQSFQVDW